MSSSPIGSEVDVKCATGFIHFCTFRLVFSQFLLSLDLIEQYLQTSYGATSLSSSVKGVLMKFPLFSRLSRWYKLDVSFFCCCHSVKLGQKCPLLSY